MTDPDARPRPVPARSASPVLVSVLVPTHQRRASILRLCDALSRQTVAPATFELVVSIDGSTDGTREALARSTPPYRLLTLWQVNSGRAAALNAAIAASSGSLLVFLDDDMEPAPSFIEAHQRAHSDGARRGVIGAAPVQIDPTADPATRYVAAKFNGHLANLRRPGRSLLLTDFYSGNFSISRALLLEVGGFDESFRAYGNEDLELSHRLRNAGVRLEFDDRAMARQHNDKSFAALAGDSFAEGRTAVLFAQKHPEVFDSLKLGTYHEGPRASCLIRDLLLSLSRRWTRLPAAVGRLERALARVDPPGMPTFYRLALGYYYWLGVEAELRSRAHEGMSCDGLLRLAADMSS